MNPISSVEPRAGSASSADAWRKTLLDAKATVQDAIRRLDEGGFRSPS